MKLDLRTIVVLMVFGSVLMTLTLAMGTRRARGAGFAKWSAGLGLYALGWLLVAVREALPPLVGIALADALLVTGICVQLAAIREFGRRTQVRALLYAPGPLLFALVLPLLDNYAALTMIVSVASGLALGAIALASVRLGRDAGPARWMLAIGYAAGALMLPLRAIDIWLAAAAHPHIFVPSDLHIATFLVLFAITIIGSVAFLLMHRERTEAELYRLATCDALTGLFNRRAFVDLAEREFKRARRRGTACAVLMMDLDHFKRVNDSHGHQAGDRVLAAFATLARQSLRSEDLVGRYGGEEFCAVLPEVTLAPALAIAERLRVAVARQPLGGLPDTITVSIGVAVCRPDNAARLDAMLARADEALYRAKQEGRDRVVGVEYGEPQVTTDVAARLKKSEATAASRSKASDVAVEA